MFVAVFVVRDGSVVMANVFPAFVAMPNRGRNDSPGQHQG